MQIADQLMAIDAIKQLKARYFRLMDTKDWSALRHVFADDAVFDARAALSMDGRVEPGRAADSNAWVYRGSDAITQFIRDAIGASITVHHGHGHEVSILSADHAEGVIAMEDRIYEPSTLRCTLHGMGHYHETYRRDGGQWRIHASRISRLYIVLG